MDPKHIKLAAETAKKLFETIDEIDRATKALTLAHGAVLISAVAFLASSQDADVIPFARWIVQFSGLGILLATLNFDAGTRLRKFDKKIKGRFVSTSMTLLASDLLLSLSIATMMVAFQPF
jgi:hypothetical protein